MSVYLDKGMRLWICVTARKNAHRIAGYSVEDLVQEGYVCFYKCYQHYVGKLLRGVDGDYHRYLPMGGPTSDNQKHFVSLVKVAFLNKITSLERKFPPVETPISALGTVEESVESKLERLMQAADLVQAESLDAALMLARAPAEIKKLFDLLVKDGLELSGRQRLKGSRRETTDEKLSRMLGLDGTLPIRKMVSDYFLV